MTVMDLDFRDIEDNLDRGSLPSREWLEYALALDYAGADGFFLSCGNVQTLDIIDRLEAESGLPVVASAQATIWMAPAPGRDTRPNPGVRGATARALGGCNC